MKTLKNNTQNIIAFVSEKTVYLANPEGRIYKQFGVSTFNQSGWTESEPTTDEYFQKFHADFIIRDAEKRAEKQAKLAKDREAAEQKAQLEREAHKRFIQNLRKWHRGEVDAFLVRTQQQMAGERGYNTDPWNEEIEISFGLDDATELFNRLKGSQEPEGYGIGSSDNGIEFITELIQLSIHDKDISDRLQVTNEKDMIEYFISSSNDSIMYDAYAPEIPEGNVIILLYHGQPGSEPKFKDAHYPVKSPFWLGDARIEAETTTADLLAFQDTSFSTYEIHMPLSEAIEEYREEIIEALSISKAQAIEAGVDESLIEELFTNEPE